MHLYIAFIDLTKAFHLVSREGLFRILCIIRYPPKLHSLIESFHNNMQGTVQFNGSTFEPLNISSGVKQGCVLAPTLFEIFFALLLKHAFGTSKEGIYLHTRSDGRLFNLASFRAKTKVREALIRDILFADDATIGSHTQQELQSLMDRFSQACKGFGLTISLKKTSVLGQGTETPPTITIDDYELQVVHQFTYLGSTVTDDLSLDVEIDKRTGNAATTLARITTRVWSNPILTEKTKMAVYNACVSCLKYKHIFYEASSPPSPSSLQKLPNGARLRSPSLIMAPDRELIFKTQITDFLIFSQEKPFGQLFSKITLKLAREFLVLRNPTKCRIAVFTLRPP